MKIAFHDWMIAVFDGHADRLAAKHVLALAALNDPWGVYDAGVRYQEGRSIEQNYEKAYRCYLRVAEIDCPYTARAQFQIGAFFLNGWHVPENNQEAARWFKLSAERGFPAAQYNYGLSLADGWGAEFNVQKGVEWLQKAAAGGIIDAHAALAKLGYSIPPLSSTPERSSSFPVPVSKARDVSQEVCPSCGGETRWLLLFTVRNVATLLLHFIAFVGTLFILVVWSGGNQLLWVFLLVIQAAILFLFRRSYKTSLRCESCGKLVRHRDVFEALRQRKVTEKSIPNRSG